MPHGQKSGSLTVSQEKEGFTRSGLAGVYVRELGHIGLCPRTPLIGRHTGSKENYQRACTQTPICGTHQVLYQQDVSL